MDRLTESFIAKRLRRQIEDGYAAPELHEGYLQYIKLAAYEDTGLEPDEVAELKNLLELALKGFEKLSKTAIKFNGARVCEYALEYANPYDACNGCPLGNGRHAECKWMMYDRARKLLEGENDEAY